MLALARERVSAAAERLRAAEGGDPTQPGWDREYEAATVAARAVERRLAALERLRAAQVERSGKRDAAVKSSAPELKSIAKALAASRDAVAAAAAEHLRTLAGLAVAEEAHNALLAKSRARLAELGLRVRDDLVDEGQEHDEGTLDGPGVRAGGTDWTPLPPGGVAAHAARTVYAACGPLHPLATVGGRTWRSFEVQSRADGLKVPSLKDAGAVAPQGPPPMVMPPRLSVAEFVEHPEAPLPGGFYKDPPPRRL